MVDEVPLAGGGRSKVWRRGEVVHREAGPWTRTVHAFLRHLESEGFDGAPRVVGPGFDEQGRETLGYIDGDFVHPHCWSEPALPMLGELFRRLHRAASTFEAPSDAVWAPWHGRALGDPSLGVSHCDLGPWNIVARDGEPQALIDWEVAGPVDPMVDLAQACWLNAQLHADDVAERQGLPPLEVRARHLRLLLDGYELPRRERTGFVDRMIEFAVHDSVAEADEAGVRPETQDPGPLWGVVWRIRSAAWMLKHRAVLQSAIV